MQLQETMCHWGLGFWRVWTHRVYPKYHTWQPNSDCYWKDCPAWSHGTRREILSGPCYDLGRVSPLTALPSIFIFLSLLPTANTSGPVWRPAQHLEPQLRPLALLHSAGNAAGTTRELWAEKIFPQKAEQDLIIASPFIHFLLVMH